MRSSHLLCVVCLATCQVHGVLECIEHSIEAIVLTEALAESFTRIKDKVPKEGENMGLEGDEVEANYAQTISNGYKYLGSSPVKKVVFR